MKGAPSCPASLERLITTPPPSLSSSSAACVQWYVPVRLMSTIRFQPLGLMSSKFAMKEAPALLTSTSSPPNTSTVVSTSASTASRSVTSHSTATASPPVSRSLIRSATGSTLSSSREQITTSTPSAANRSAIAFPMPLDAPVTIAVDPSTPNRSPVTVARPPCVPWYTYAPVSTQ